VIVDELNLSEAKTKIAINALKNLVGQATALIVLAEKDQAYATAMRSANNLSDTKILLASYLNIRDLFGYEKVVLPEKTLDALVASLG
jgi:large subunit ribosomal protein L4